MYWRSIHIALLAWKAKANRKPLILRGARQVGKTILVNMFAREFDHYVYLNLELFEDKSIFKEECSLSETVQALALNKNHSFTMGTTLIFILMMLTSTPAIILCVKLSGTA
ncbi:MAG TPA: hypothetical protein DD477_04700 [Spirochaetaceae bacterium]|nr:hypothetical protein [Spirochaetaceae bacterium]HAW86389.1 hypothetical protein [Spirochaetaceae bacterium]HAX38190.1 hypothetical protein [Spirochaetaceae bacterium]HBO40502.1 hypothetical protein [Spirochaetaceae bacterium]HCQ86314.1 hypothetical protein [Spirochaetaceae bacterium]